MEWTTIDYGGTLIEATDFLDGVLVCIGKSMIFVQGYYVQEQLGDMDGPALRKSPTRHPVYGVQLRVEGEVGR